MATASGEKGLQSPRARRREVLREQLLGAIQELAESGTTYTDMAVEQLAQHAGIARSTFYVYFEDKGQLLREWVEEVFAKVSQAAKQWYDLPDDASRDDIHKALSHILLSYRPHISLIATVLDASGQDRSIRDAFDLQMEGQVRGLRRYIERGQRKGAIDNELPAAATAGWLTWMAERGLHKVVAVADDKELDDVLAAYSAIVWKALYT